MKKRLLSAAVGLVLLGIVFWKWDTPLLPIAAALLSAGAVYELLTATRQIAVPRWSIPCVAFAFADLFFLLYGEDYSFPAAAVFCAALILCKLIFHSQFSFQQLAVCITATLAVPLAFYSLLRMMYSQQGGIIYLLLVSVAAWVTDTGAFFAGKAFGKHKLAPALSPKKTVEGAIGGLLLTGILFPTVCCLYGCFGIAGTEVSIGNSVVVGLVCAVAGMLGDLFASSIKRDAGIKDFGKIMPGHGGVMDRFDSFLFAAPVMLALLGYFPIFLFK